MAFAQSNQQQFPTNLGDQPQPEARPPASFMKCPLEIREQIYSYFEPTIVRIQLYPSFETRSIIYRSHTPLRLIPNHALQHDLVAVHTRYCVSIYGNESLEPSYLYQAFQRIRPEEVPRVISIFLDAHIGHRLVEIMINLPRFPRLTKLAFSSDCTTKLCLSETGFKSMGYDKQPDWWGGCSTLHERINNLRAVWQARLLAPAYIQKARPRCVDGVHVVELLRFGSELERWRGLRS